MKKTFTVIDQLILAFSLICFIISVIWIFFPAPAFVLHFCAISIVALVIKSGMLSYSKFKNRSNTSKQDGALEGEVFAVLVPILSLALLAGFFWSLKYHNTIFIPSNSQVAIDAYTLAIPILMAITIAIQIYGFATLKAEDKSKQPPT